MRPAAELNYRGWWTGRSRRSPLRCVPGSRRNATSRRIVNSLLVCIYKENPIRSGIILPLFDSMNRLESMAILIAVVDAGSLSAAARRLDMPLATVSRKVAELEAHLTTRLLHRTTRQLSLTEAGASYVAACRRILEEIGEAERAATGEYAAPKGELADSALMATRVGAVRRVVCASPAYLAAHGVPERPQDLAGHDCVTFEVLASMRAWVFGSGKSQLSVPVNSRLTVNTAEAAIAAATLGVGLIRVLSYQVADALREEALCIVLDQFESAPLPISLVHTGQAPLPLKLRAFLDFVTPRLRTRTARK